MHVAIIGAAATAGVLLTRVSSWFDKQVPASSGSIERTLEAGSIFAPHEQADIRIWVWLRNPGAARLFFAVVERPGSPPRYLVNDVPLERGLDELGMEELGQVVYASAMALWTGNLESTRGEIEARLPHVPAVPPALPPARRPARATRSSVRLRLGLEYALRLRGDEGSVQVPGALGGIALGSRESELSFVVHAGVFVPSQERTQGIDLHLSGTSLALGAGGALQATERVWLTSELAPSIALVHYDPRSADSHVRAGAAKLDPRPELLAALGVRFEASGIQFGVRAQAAFELVRTHYDLDGPDGRHAVLTPWLIQPGAALQISW